MGDGEIAQLIKCLPHEHENLRSISSTHVKSQAHACKAETDPWSSLAGQASQISELQVQ